MFTRAVRGLASQQWERCMIRDEEGSDLRCAYTNGDGMHCAWGWVDADLTAENSSSVWGLWHAKRGAASDVLERDLDFAAHLQSAHDRHSNPDAMRRAFIKLHQEYCLAWPSDVPKE